MLKILIVKKTATYTSFTIYSLHPIVDAVHFKLWLPSERTAMEIS